MQATPETRISSELDKISVHPCGTTVWKVNFFAYIVKKQSDYRPGEFLSFPGV
jgi:hypothetical protein